ncbi:hypothetical protein HBI56_013240 [Parastagonospora nodorum]|uniref:Uncharacterized protein n=1 Tax=Phaeosphaeria nodorum (strain SN15 / ATCC MYA-4574 / FGSC 10173) TaxID=321614 RepID=A0A7U2HSW7_PHANO|nr:hypothetical protein HBH56_008380 [Parastagonospora nodorum]QRC90585.1 hypothetical protein JI435_300080 [Parastagonospora nodorum SN15]KAH3922140.1 hypothetical protein HBH54_227430 [Parastagonospora nodorum]KAH3939341.1 hypothetical protein HBH53_236830 [Parastagonospora nodorum]KAH3987157.1 hypothetical protein HBH51_014930 [Parastagonospora nodorum]
MGTPQNVPVAIAGVVDMISRALLCAVPTTKRSLLPEGTDQLMCFQDGRTTLTPWVRGSRPPNLPSVRNLDRLKSVCIHHFRTIYPISIAADMQKSELDDLHRFNIVRS